jgi:hypothetical protein
VDTVTDERFGSSIKIKADEQTDKCVDVQTENDRYTDNDAHIFMYVKVKGKVVSVAF